MMRELGIETRERTSYLGSTRLGKISTEVINILREQASSVARFPDISETA